MIDQAVVKKVLRAFENKDVSLIRKCMIEQQVNPNGLIPSKGVCLLHLIIGHPSESFAFKITKLFLKCGGDPNVQSSDGVTPTHVAAGWGRNRILHLLLVNGGDPWIQDEDKRNAFNYAFEEQEWTTVEMLHHFQQMHSAVNSKVDSVDDKIKLELERILFKKGEELFAYSTVQHSNKSVMTEAPGTCQPWNSLPSSPIQNKIKYFEPNEPKENGVWKIPEKSDQLGWSKDIYETNKVIICDASAETSKDSASKKKKTFISSIHLDGFPRKETSHCRVKKPIEDPEPKDVRGQLFVELREAVRRRSKQKIDEERENGQETPAAEDPKSDSVLFLKDTATAPEKNLSSSALNLVDNSGLLKNMSDFATRVMENDKMSKEKAENTIDLCSSGLDSFEPDSAAERPSNSRTSSAGKMQTFIVPQCGSDNSTVYLTPYNSTLNSEAPRETSKEEGSNESFVSVSEEYKYTDAEEGIVLLEKKLVVTPTVSLIFDGDEKGEEDDDDDHHHDNDNDKDKRGRVQDGEKEASASCSSSSTSSLTPSTLSCNSDILRSELLALGHDVGPVTKTTKKLYVKKLQKLKTDAKIIAKPPSRKLVESVHSPVLRKTLSEGSQLQDIQKYKILEEEMCRSFEKWTKRQWREGTNKTSFNYLLLDPRTSANLPKRVDSMTESEAWKCFLSAIFYVGKGKRSRPYAHLYKATTAWRDRKNDGDEKVELITQIWREGLGVVCLQVFQNVMPVEAYTREATMIDALDLTNLKNVKRGEYYGVVSTWSARDKQKLGIYLLYKAYLIFLNEGERQIKPYDI